MNLIAIRIFLLPLLWTLIASLSSRPKRVIQMSLITLIITLVGCSSAPQQSAQFSTNWQQHQQQLTALTHYKVSGKLGYKDGNHRQSLSFVLQQQDNSSDLRLLTFLGQTVLKLHMSSSGTLITDNQGQQHSGHDANRLIKQLTGLAIPVQQLPDWLKGLPTQADEYQLNDSHTLAQLTKNIDGMPWLLDYQSYQFYPQTQQPKLPMPQQLQLTHAQTELKIAINNWTF